MAERVVVLVCKLECPSAMRFLSSLVKECEEWEEKIMTRYTDNILRGEVVEHRRIKEKIRKNDRSSSVSVWRSPFLLLKWQRTSAGVNCGTPLGKSTLLGCRN